MKFPLVSRKALDRMAHQVQSFLWGAISNRTKRDYSLTNPTASSLLMAVTLWVVRRWPEAPITLEEIKANGAKGNVLYEHAMLAKIEQPNPYYSGVILWYGTIMSLMLDGNGYWVKLKSKRDLSVQELWYVPHTMMRPMVRNGSDNFIDYYEYSPGGRNPIELDPADVVHFRMGLDPNNPRLGMAPLKSVIRAAATDEEADNFAASMLINMGVPGLMITPDLAAGQSVAAGDLDATKKYIEENFTGDKRGKPMILSGPTKVQQFGFSPDQMNLGDIRNIPEERVCAVTGVPAAVVGFGTGLQQTTVGATIKTLREMAYEDAIIPLQRLIGPQIAGQLLVDFEPRPEKFRVAFDLSGVRVLQDDQDALYTRTINAFNGGLISRADGRLALGFEVGPADNIRRVPFSVTEVPEGEMVPTYDPVEPAAKGLKGRKGARRDYAFIRAQKRAEARLNAAFIPDLTDGFKEIADRCVTAYESTKARVPDGRKAEELTPAEEIELETEAAAIFVSASVLGQLSDVLAWKGHYIAATKSTIKNMSAIFGISLDLPDEVQREVIAKGGIHFARINVDKQTHDGIFKALLQGRTEGLGPREIARQIRYNVEGSDMYPGVYKDAYKRAIARGWSEEKAKAAGDKAARQYRAEVISRTETKYAQNVSSIEAAKASGTFDAMLVFDAQLGPTDAECEELNGQTVSFEEAEALAESEHPNGTRSFSMTIRGGA